METVGDRTEVSSDELVKRLERHPQMKARIGRVLDVLENTSGDLQRADDAEQRAIDELRAMGQELLQGWAEGQVKRIEREVESGGQVVRQVKKTLLEQHVRRNHRCRANLSE